MPDLCQLLREKEIAIERVRREIEALRLVSNLLYDEGDFTPNTLDSGLAREKASGVLRLVDERGESFIAVAGLVHTVRKA